MPEVKSKEPAVQPAEQAEEASRFPDLEQMQQEIDRRIRDNRRFLERFMDEDFEEDEVEEEGEGESGEEFEELDRQF